MMQCKACEQRFMQLFWVELCEGCYNKGTVWAAKQALAAERYEQMHKDALGVLSVTLDPRALTEWPGNCAPPEFGKQTIDIGRGLGDAGIPGITPNVLGSNAEQIVDSINEQPVSDPFYVKQREDWRNQT